MPEISTGEHAEDIVKIKDWLAKQPHLPQNVDDNLLMKFLHTCNYSLEQSKHLIDLFFTIRSQAPEIFGNRDVLDSSIKDIFNVIDLVPLSKPTKENYRVFVYRLCDPNPDKYVFVDALRAFFMMTDVRLKEETILYAGQVPVFDMEGFTLRHLAKATLPLLKKYMTYTQEAHPVKLKQIHIINTSSFLDRLLALVKPFMKSEVASVLHFHLPKSETLYEYIPRDMLPVEYGGTEGKLVEMKKEWVQKIIDHRDYFLDETRWKVEESKRPIENKNRKQHFDMQGSFRSLAID